MPVEAYLATDYVVNDGDRRFICRIGEPNRELPQELLPAVVITAFNPYGATLSDDENLAANELLRSNLKLLSATVLSGYGQGRDGGWPPEPSFFAVGIDRPRAAALGMLWRQNAVVWIGLDRVPELLITKSD
jgi:hypothetical protein